MMTPRYQPLSLEIVMRFIVRVSCCIALAIVTAGAQRATDARDALVVSTAWLAQHLKDPDLVLLFLGDDNDYNKAHIPGSYNIRMEEFAVDDMSANGLMLEVLPVDRLRDSLGALGITDRSRIVVYAGKGFLPWATRFILTLDHAGLGARSSLLDGGLPAWVKAGGAVNAVVPPKRKSELASLHVKPVIVDADFVKARIGKPGVSIVDGRSPAFYTGASTGQGHAGLHRSGHIASAKNVPFNAPYTDDGFVRPTAELRALFDKAGVAPGDTVIGYCHIGQQATAMLFGARVLGHPVRLYDGSFEDWSRRPPAEYVVEAPRGQTKP
jgi:thiosulfate/3-mercaptopyruvate sulfurtransferase